MRRAHRQPELFGQIRRGDRGLGLRQALDHPDATHDRALERVTVDERLCHADCLFPLSEMSE